VPLKPGLCAEVELTVTEADTAFALRSGSVHVLATPRVVALVEEASCAAIENDLADGETSVGNRVEVSHLQPTRVGSVVRAESTLEKVEGRRLTFTVSVSDKGGLVAAGKVTRVVVDVDRFLEKAR